MVPPMKPDVTPARYQAVRAHSEALCRPLAIEDHGVQSMAEASPPKWHLAHTSWFFETFVLAAAGHAPFHPAYAYLFNSYYDAVGARHPRPQRGLLTRPTVAEIYRYRSHVDASMVRFLEDGADDGALALTELGLHHEQQHQELILTDLKHAFAQNPLRPAYEVVAATSPRTAPRQPWVEIGGDGGVHDLGCDPAGGFAFDNEGPRHRAYVAPFRLASCLVTAGEWLAFVEDGGYRTPALWLSDGWTAVQTEGWAAPLYWEARDGGWWHFTLAGMQPVPLAEPVRHVSYYEADAFARWAGKRLPREAEWEVAATSSPAELSQLFDECWQWTASPYVAYPGFRPAAGAVGEYNGKFMCNQMVLRGGSCLTPPDHTRPTYRNFFPPAARWQMTGVRLANDR